MAEQWFQVELLSDIVVTADAATAGGHEGLDYLPGSLFLGAAVAATGSFSPELFLSGKVRFLDAFVATEGKPTFPIPLAFHHYKGEAWENKAPINLLTSPHIEKSKQPKQWRRDYMAADGSQVDINTAYSMKTAIDRTKRRAAEAKLFGYESIPAGLIFYVRVQANNTDHLDMVKQLFISSPMRIGKSRSAEYGSVRMKAVLPPIDYSQPQRQCSQISVYLLSDLMLLRKGMPVLLPEFTDFGLPIGTRLDAEKTFLRTRRYAPWNSFYNCRMEERQVICKGSVLTFQVEGEVSVSELQQRLASGIGMHREEGLGQILINPSWLFAPPILRASRPMQSTHRLPGEDMQAPDTSLINFLRGKSLQQAQSLDAYNAGNQWAKEWHAIAKLVKQEHGKAPSKSQWSTIREIAIRCMTTPAKKLSTEVERFCGNALRRKVWADATVRIRGEQRCIKDAVLQKVENRQGNTALTLYYAAIAMSRLLGRG